MDRQTAPGTRISTPPGELKRGDILRDCGTNRVVERTEPGRVDRVVIVYFQDELIPRHLGVPAGQNVTAWRTEAA